MIVILISWLVFFYMISITGIIVRKSLKLSNDKAFVLLYGIIFQTLFIAIFAFFYKIGLEFFVLNWFLILIISYALKNEISTYLKLLFISFSLQSKIIFSFLVFIIAFKSAQIPTIFDNESYYIQTIKWLNEYGYVKGIANVHPFLAQCSFWHVFQSGFNFSFISSSFNDINGLLLLVGLYYFFEKYSLKPNFYSIINSLFLIVYFQFIDAPSPDLPVLIFSSIIFYEFLFNTLHSKNRKALLLFLLYLVFIKLTVFPLLFLVFSIVRKNRMLFSFFFKLSLVFGIVWVLKNIIITGYPLFPLSFFDLNLDWKLPSESMQYMFKNINNLGYAENASILNKYNLFQKLNFWIHLKGINGFFNIGTLILFLLIPFTKSFKALRNFKILYLILLIHFLFLLINSPQYRFFLPTFICFGSLVLLEISTYMRFLNRNSVFIFSLFLLSFSLFFDLKKGTILPLFKDNQILFPASTTKYENAVFVKKNIGNLTYFDPNLPNLYETSNGKLPCVNQKLFNFYTFFPQKRTTNIADGFYAKRIKNE